MSLNKPIYKLRDWIDVDKLNWRMLSMNKNSINLLEKYPEKINWNDLSYNKNAIELLKKNHEKINRKYIS